MAAVKSTVKTFGGILQRMTHQSAVCKCEMTFAVYLPSQAETAAVPCLYWLSGLTCTDENFSQKAGGFRAAAARGLALVMPDTSPRGVTIEGADDAYDFGSGAGFYVDATEAKWKEHYQMYSYVTTELPEVLAATFPGKFSGKASITGHSMGGHGALTLFLKNPGKYASASAFSPICNPTAVPWGKKAFEGYLGSVEAGKAHDAVELINAYSGAPFPLLVDQGAADNFLTGDVNQLQPTKLAEACASKGIDLNLRMQEGYDHSYYFISSFIEDHINFHADALAK
jgi:S-formylglutathione hydrolase